jgi:hypothetical protein
MMAFSPIAVSDTVPRFDIASECHFEGDFDRCSQDEAAALSNLKTEWAQSNGLDHKTCVASTTTGGFRSYVELLTCLEMTRDAARANGVPTEPRTKSVSQPTQTDPPGVTVGEAHRH